MTTDFDDFVQERDQKKQDATNLAVDAQNEWEVMVKGFALEYASNGREIDGHRFKAESDLTGCQMLVLNNVAATFIRSGQLGAPQKYRVRFSRRPPGSMQAYDEESRLPAREWLLEPAREKGEFFWYVPERSLKKSAANLASEIAKELVTFHDEYERAYRRVS